MKPLKSFQEMLIEKYQVDSKPNPQKIQSTTTLQPHSYSTDINFSSITQFPKQAYPIKTFDINAMVPPIMGPFELYGEKNKGVHSVPQSPIILPSPSVRSDQRMVHPSMDLNKNNPFHQHPGFSQFKKEISDRKPSLGFHSQSYEDIFFNSSYQNSPEFRAQTVAPIGSSVTSQVSSTTSSFSERFTGKLKFFDEVQNYGFFVLDIDNSDLFVHYEDLRKAGVNKEFLKALKGNSAVKFSFNCVTYYGKYSLSRKAINIEYYFEQEKAAYSYNK